MTPRNDSAYDSASDNDEEYSSTILNQKTQHHDNKKAPSSPTRKKHPSKKTTGASSPPRHNNNNNNRCSPNSNKKSPPSTKSKKAHRSVRFDQSVLDNAQQHKQSPPTPTTPGATAAAKSSITIKTSQTQSSWELTWPIWHMLPRDERKAIASSYGYKSIGEFEEYMSLEKAVGVSEKGRNNNKDHGPYENERLYQVEAHPGNYGVSTIARKQQQHQQQQQDDDDDESSSDEEDDDEVDTPSNTPTNTTTTTTTTTTNNNDPFLLLPEEILTLHIFPYLDVDYYSTLSLVSPNWKYFTRTEFVYKQLCVRCYLNQSKKKALHVHRFGGSYRRMLEERPRVKTGGGLYVLKYSEVVKIQRDMWTEIPVGAVLENVYYRYLYFHENSRVLYALTHISPHEMIPKLLHMKSTGEPVKSTVWGKYEVKGCDVTVWASHPWHDVKMDMKLVREGVDGAKGRFCAMTFEKHLSSVSGNFDEYYSPDLVDYKVPNEYFRFLRDWRL